MQKAKNFISQLIFNKFFWQLILAGFMISTAVFFIIHEHIEIVEIRKHLLKSNLWFVLLGIGLTGVYLFFQAEMYVYSFKATGSKISLKKALLLFLKRNFISVFLPAGGFSSLLFFTKEVEKEGATKSQIHLASTLFAFVSLLSVVLVALPVLAFALFLHDLQGIELIGLIFLLVLVFLFVGLAISVSRKGKIYRCIIKLKPSLGLILDEMIEHQLKRKEVWSALLFSVLIEFIGIAHLYIAMAALGFSPSLPAAIIGYVVMVILLIASPFLRGLGAIEVALTVVLEQFGFPVTAAAAITLLYRFFEFWLPLFSGLVSFVTRKDNLLLRILPASIIFILGVVNIISSVTPAIPARMHLINGLLPENVIRTSNGLVLVFGLALVILSAFLFKGSRRAWVVAVFLTFLSLTGHLVKGIDYEEAILALIAVLSLLYTRRFYYLKPDPRLTRISYLVILYSILALVSFGITAFYFIDKRHFGVEFEFMTAVKTIFRLFFLFDDSGLNPKTRFAHDFIVAIYFSGTVVFCFIFYSLLKPYFTKPYNSKEDFEKANLILKKYGASALDYFKTYPDKYFFFSDDGDGFIAFKVTRHFAVVLENPVCRNEHEMIELINRFDGFCEENGFICIYYRVPGHSLNIFKNLGWKSFPVGEEAIVDLGNFTLDGQKMKPTRNAINRITTVGFQFRVYDPPIKEGLLQKLEQVSDKWLKEHNQKEIAFTQGIFDKTILKNQTICTIEDAEDKVYAFLNIIPDFVKGEATYDLVRKIGDTPNGVLDMLIVKTLLYFKEKGFLFVNLGLAPLSGVEGENLTQKTIKYAYENLRTFGHFKGLRKFKEKFFPHWELKYLIYRHNYHLMQVPNALKRVSEGN